MIVHVWTPSVEEEKTIAQVFEESYMVLGETMFMGEKVNMFRCKKCGEKLQELFLYSHHLDHKNPNAKFGKEAWDYLSEEEKQNPLIRDMYDSFWEGEE